MNSSVATAPERPASKKRLVSLDQFRGYTVLGMLLVNYFGRYDVCPQVLRHTNDYCSYADTIMPQFLFAVGFALRLTIGRRLQTHGQELSAYLRIFRRLLGLMLISLIIYKVDLRVSEWHKLKELGLWGVLNEPLKRQWFQTLMHIAVTSLWILPVISCRAPARVLWLVASGLLHVVLSYWFNFVWCNTPPNAIDGGPLGFLTWSIPALVGTLACDAFVDSTTQPGSLLWRTSLAAVGLMTLGYLLSCPTRLYDVPESQRAELAQTSLAKSPVWPSAEQVATKRATNDWRAWLAEPPLVKPPVANERKWNYWMMSQRAGTLSYLVFAAGFSLLVFVLFYLICDVWGWQNPWFRTFGTNALVAYILHPIVSSAIQPFVPHDAPGWYAYAWLTLYFNVNWICLRSLEKQNIFLRV